MINRMKELINTLSKAAKVYEQGEDEIMTNYEYDKLYDELLQLEQESGLVMAGSVTQNVGYEIQSKLPKITHTNKMLSLDKTKDSAILGEILGNEEGLLSWKLDGLTVSPTYENGKIAVAVTRGNGSVGEDITNNYKNFINIPLTIPTEERLVLRGEAVISYSNFEQINSKIEEVENKYKNPRNLCSGSVRQLDPNETKNRTVEFILFEVVEGFNDLELKSEKLERARSLGFEIVDYKTVTQETTEKIIEEFKQQVKDYKYPTDGLVLTVDNIEKGNNLGSTSKFPRHSKAFKWEDEAAETELLEVFWSNSRTGAINPVAVFKPVELEGTTVTRASVHNISIIEELELGVGDIVKVIKSNMIIPQIIDNVTRSNNLEIPKECPVCGEPTTIEQQNKAKVLYCRNEDCLAKQIGKLNHFTTRDAMNIEGLSEATFERLVSEGLIKDFKDIYYLSTHKDIITKMEGFGIRSYENIINAVEKSREVELPAFLYALGVEQLGRTTSRLICNALGTDIGDQTELLEAILGAAEGELVQIEGIGNITAREVSKYFSDHADMVRELALELKFKEPKKVDKSSDIAGKTFVVTGSVYQFKNRKELQTKIESLGGKVTGSVTTKTDYLLNNDVNSTSSKNKKAKELNIPIITEEDLIKMIGA